MTAATSAAGLSAGRVRPGSSRALGMSLGQYHDRSIYDYHTEIIENTLDDLAARGVTHIDVCPTWFMPDKFASEIRDLGEDWYDGKPGVTMSDSSLVYLIQRCQGKGLKVVLKPMVEVNGYTPWRGEITPSDTDAWFSNYQTMMLHYAVVAAAQGVDLLCVGTEYETMVGYTAKWRALIAAVRLVYNGKLAYGANWDGVDKVAFFDDLDYIGADLYAPAADTNAPTLDQLKAAIYGDLRARLEPVYEAFQKPVMIMEFGIQNVDGAVTAPYRDWTAVDPPPARDDQEQADYYTAFLQAAAELPYVRWISAWETDIIQASVAPSISFNPSAAATAAFAAAGSVFLSEDPYTPYSVEAYQADNHTGYRLWRGTQHFLSVIFDANGGFALRPHPGLDPNGWGSTWYPHAFLPGATLRGAAATTIAAHDEFCAVAVGGLVSAGANGSYGTWQVALRFSFNPLNRKVTGTGTYAVALSGPLSSETGDLNLQKIASNRLRGVTLLDGSTGNTGDMQAAVLSGTRRTPPASFHQTWLPGESGYDNPYYPQDRLDELCTTVTGAYNRVDSVATGRTAAIAAAYKPNLVVNLSSYDSGLPLIFGAAFDEGKAQDFEQDNVGLMVIVRNATAVTAFTFDVSFESTPLADENVVVPRLDPGWNLLTVPFPVAFTLSEILQPDSGSLAQGTAWVWNADTGRYHRAVGGTRPTPGVGYWVYSPQGGAARVLAGPFTARQVALIGGWNLVAPGTPGPWPSESNVRAAWSWDSLDQHYDLLPQDSRFDPSHCYWLYSVAPCNVVW